MEAALIAPDWDAPWLARYRRVGERVHARWREGLPLHDALNAERLAPVRFEAPAAQPGVPYEQYVATTGRCPTRANAHDFFNGLVWLHFPWAKRQANRLHAAELASAPPGARRGPVRDALTLLDENGALLVAPDPLWDALEQRDWRRLFMELRPLWRSAHLVVFGHALLEQLAAPRKDLTAHVWRRRFPAETAAGALDGLLAQDLVPARLAGKPFTPLPVMGVPGWCAGNENFSFYDDSLVFRPAGPQNNPQQTGRRPAP